MVHDEQQELVANGFAFAPVVVGEYIAMPYRVNNAIAYAKKGDVGIALWYVSHEGKFWWYVGPIQEIGTASGWLRTASTRGGTGGLVACEACEHNAEQQWYAFALHAQQSWKPAPSVCCVDIGDVGLILLRGRLPIADVQSHAHLGEFARVPHQASNRRPVYEKVGQPEVIMWYAPAGAWVVGHLANVGSNMGGLCCVSDARLPELVSTARWAVFDVDQRVWITHRTLVDVVPLGTPRVRLRDVGQEHPETYALKNVDFVRVLPAIGEFTCFYRATDNRHAMWSNGGAWILGTLDIHDGGVESRELAMAKDDAYSPDLVRASWCALNTAQLNLCGAYCAMAFVASCSPRVVLSGGSATQRHQDKLGEYERVYGILSNGRGVYRQVGNPGRMIWFSGGHWFVGRATELGECHGWLSAHHDVPTPDQVRTTWRISNQGSSQGTSVTSAPDLRCVRMGHRAVRVQYVKDEAAFAQLGIFVAAPGRLRNDKPFYECLASEDGERYVAWSSNGYWFIGCGDLGVDKMVVPWVQICDAACVLEDVSESWTEWQAQSGKWKKRKLRFTPAEGDLSMRPPARIGVKAKIETTKETCAHRLGVFVLVDELCNDCPVYTHEGERGRMLWRLAPHWYIGKSADRGTARGWLQVRSTARSPERIKEEWQVWDQAQGRWSDAPGVCVSVLPQSSMHVEDDTDEMRTPYAVEVAVGVSESGCESERISERISERVGERISGRDDEQDDKSASVEGASTARTLPPSQETETEGGASGLKENVVMIL